MSESAHDQAEAMIESMGGLDAAISGADMATTLTPEINSATPAPEVEGTPETQQESPHWTDQARDELGRWINPQGNEGQGSVEDTASFMGEGFDPNGLAPELQQRYKDMQAHFTRRTQELSGYQRQLQQFGDLEEIQAAVQLRQTLADPRSWVQLHTELTDNLQRMGLSPAQAQAEATRQMDTPSTPGEMDFSSIEDPDIAPVAKQVQTLQGQLSQVQNEFRSYLQQQQEQQQEMALIGHMQSQENAIRQANPHYNQGDIDAMYELSSFYDGDLFRAQQRYDQIFSDRVGRWIESKRAAASAGPRPVSGASTTSTQPKDVNSWADARAAALEFAAQMDAQ